MSQQGILSDQITPLGGDIETLTGDSGGPVGPDGAANVNIIGGPGITVEGDPGTFTLTIIEDEVLEGTGTTVGATTDDVITLDLGGTASAYTMEARVGSFESSTPAGGGMWVLGVFRTDGASASLVATEAEDTFLEAALMDAEVAWVASGNDAILRVTGVAGLTVNWAATAEYVQAS